MLHLKVKFTKRKSKGSDCASFAFEREYRLSYCYNTSCDFALIGVIIIQYQCEVELIVVGGL